VNHEQDNENGFERRSWSPPTIKDTSSTLRLGMRDPRPSPGAGGGVGRGAGFRENPECSCWRCAVERLCRQFEVMERAAPEPTPHWDAGLAAEIEAVQELDAEIDALQGMDAAARRRALFLDDEPDERDHQGWVGS
jgi:hypothetical protein